MTATFTTRAAVLAFGLAMVPASAMTEELRIGTASLGGAYFPVGQTIANLVNRHAEGLTMVPIVTGGGIENPRLVVSGEVDMGIANANTAYFAFRGEPPYSESLDIAALGSLHSSSLHIVTLADSDIETFEDMRGRRVAVGPAGGGALNFLQNLLEAHGMEMTDIQPSFLSFADGFSQLSDGNVDVSLALAGFPTSAVVQAMASNSLKFIEIGEEELAAVFEAHPYYSAITVPAGTYDNSEPVVMLGVRNLLFVRSDMDEERAHALTAALYDNLDEFIEENALGREIEPESSLELVLPLHPGALRYFEERF